MRQKDDYFNRNSLKLKLMKKKYKPKRKLLGLKGTLFLSHAKIRQFNPPNDRHVL
jgi:hypothetical protein